MGRKRKKTGVNLCSNNEIFGVILFAVGAFSALSIYFTDYSGKIGSLFKTLLMGLFGIAAYLMPFFIMASGILSIASYYKRITKPRLLVYILSALILLSIIHMFFFSNFDSKNFYTYIASSYNSGIKGIGTGVSTSVITFLFYSLFGLLGSFIILISLFIITLLVLTKLSLKKLGQAIYKMVRTRTNGLQKKKAPVEKKPAKKPFVGEVIHLDDPNPEKDLLTLESSFANKPDEEKQEVENIKIINFDENGSKDVPSAENDMSKSNLEDLNIEKLDIKVSQLSIPYVKPPISLLKEYKKRKSGGIKEKHYIENARILEETLNSFGVSAKVIQISKGPVITRYELQPAPGVKVSRIVNLADDIALNLAAQGVRIEAPIPGKAAVGIEVPNKDVSPVHLREVLDTDSFINHSSKISFALGKDITGNNIIADINKMPHLLIAGATGSGKSVCINSLIISILYKANPDEVKLIMIDPKVVELNNYNGIPHLMIPVVTDPKKAAGALNWAVQEMINRYKSFADKGVRDFERYNELIKENDDEEALLPQIVIIIDELADLMMVAPNDVEDAICRLAQMARAAGIHLVIATQRPSVDVITGVIKANIPSRIAFAVSSQVDSRTILDMSGAEKLLGRGDMLYSPVGANKPIRVQGAFISEKEVEAVVSYIKNQNNKPEYDEDVIKEIATGGESSSNDMDDELFPEAVEIVVEAGQASISMLQRKLRIGYNRAARMIDEMEARGIVSGYNGSKSRTVLLSKEEFEENYKAN